VEDEKQKKKELELDFIELQEDGLSVLLKILS
jgi:hypothetical protein